MKGSALGAACESLLESFVTELTAAGVTVPAWRYVGAGNIAWDGEGLAIYLGSIDQGQPGVEFGGTYTPAIATNLTITIYVMLIRVAPTLNDLGEALDEAMPSMVDLDTAGQAAMNDAAALVQAAVNIHDKYLATGPGEGFAIGPVSPLGPMGGLSAMRLELKMSLS